MDAVVLAETDIGNQELGPVREQPGASRLEIRAADDARDVGQRMEQLGQSLRIRLYDDDGGRSAQRWIFRRGYRPETQQR